MTRTTGPEMLALSSGRLSLQLCPEIGGSIAAFRWDHPAGGRIDLMRPLSEADLGAGNVLGMASFPLTPFSNRINEGRFAWRGHNITLPLNALPERHAQHGHGWQRPWQIVETSGDHVTLELNHSPDAWPFAYRMQQRFRLTGETLELELTAANLSNIAMPYGFGIHPYFPKTARCTLTAGVKEFWEIDHEVMPTRLVKLPAHADPTRGMMISAVDLDNCYTGFDGKATIAWPERLASLKITASTPLSFLVVYAPPSEAYFCVEPVSNSTDAFNLTAAGRKDTGMLTLQPEQAVSATVVFRPQVLG
jgi:aldose 1-epimerase